MRPMELLSYLNHQRGRAVDLARAISVSPGFVSQIASRRRPCPAAVAVSIELATEGAVRRWTLCPTDWHRIWPELIGAEGAPPVPTETKEVA